jgi:hypothetical protein
MHGIDLDVNGSQIAGPVNGVSGMQPPQSAAGFHAGQQPQQQLEEQQRQLSLQQQPQAHGIAQQQLSHIDSANLSGGSSTSYKDDSEEPRGRERSRDGPGGEMERSETSANGRLGSSAETPATRKRRRSRKGLDKKFECPQPGCGKSYSRAEHLYRHQLNRKTPLILRPDKKKAFRRSA